MPETPRQYFDNKVPMTVSAPSPSGPPAPDWRRSWNNLARQVYVVMPTQLDRARSFRNRFIRAVE